MTPRSSLNTTSPSRPWEQVIHYVCLLQGEDAPTLQDIAVGGYYGTSALSHEVAELDILLEREPRLLEMDRDTILTFWHANIEEAGGLIDESYPIRFRVRPEIRTVEGASHREIRARLWEVIFEEMEKRRAERQVEYAAPEPACVPLRERSEEPIETELPEQ
ncbi:MAG TPA: hypothetical protein EYP49_01775 [Anaerolineae bacterium]|nr:hypothetical protein [Anaerolineae bacterium]